MVDEMISVKGWLAALILILLGGMISGLKLYNKPHDTIFVIRQPGNQIQLNIALGLPEGAHPLAHYTEHLAWLPNFGKNFRPEDLTDRLRQLKVVFDPVDLPREMAEIERDSILRAYDWRSANNPDARAAEEMAAFLHDGNAIAAGVFSALITYSPHPVGKAVCVSGAVVTGSFCAHSFATARRARQPIRGTGNEV